MLRIWRCDCALCVIGNSFHAAHHTIPPPPSYEGLPRCTKDKNRSPFHGDPPPSPSENVSWMHIIEGRTAIATPLKPI